MGVYARHPGKCLKCGSAVSVSMYDTNRPYAAYYCERCGIRFQFRTEDNLAATGLDRAVLLKAPSKNEVVLNSETSMFAKAARRANNEED